MVHRFEQEHHVYHKFYFDGYDLRKIANAKRDQLSDSGAKVQPKIPPFGKEIKRPASAGYMEREPGFENDCISEKEVFTIDDRIRQEMEESKRTNRKNNFSPTRIPRYNDPDHRRHMTAVKADYERIKNNRRTFSQTDNYRDSMDSARDDLNATQSSNAGSQHGKTIDIRQDGQLDYFRGTSKLSKTQKATANRLKSSKDEQLDVVIESFSTKGKRVKPKTRASFINKDIEKK